MPWLSIYTRITCGTSRGERPFGRGEWLRRAHFVAHMVSQPPNMMTRYVGTFFLNSILIITILRAIELESYHSPRK
jgi:hypothetical protein